MSAKCTYFLLFTLLITSVIVQAQEPVMRGIGNRVQQMGGGRRMGGSTGGSDTLTHRNRFEDSITIRFRYLDSARNYTLDSSINDFHRRFPIPATHIYLGNTGNATRSLLFSPSFDAGFDPGFHGFDVYKWNPEQARFFTTTRPYSEINYFLGSRVEQIIELMHTQNLKPTWNIHFQYRLINSPGFFKNQKTNHNNYLLTSWFQSNSKRYNNYFMLVGNKLQSSENGGMRNDRDYLDDPVFKDRFLIYTNIGEDGSYGTNFLSTTITSGNKYNEFTALFRQQLDFGRKDSVVTDSTVIPLFYPRLRFEHTIRYGEMKYIFQDLIADSVYYKNNYDTTLQTKRDTVLLQDKWREISNDFSIYQFPDAKNLQQFIRLGITLQHLNGEFTASRKSFINTIGHAEYRNKTRNKQWDFEATGKLWFTGLNQGDYQAYVSLQRFIGKKQGYLQLGFQNANRTPSFVFDPRSSFYTDKPKDFKKENNTHFFGTLYMPFLQLKLSGNYYLLTNYTYLTEFYKMEQHNVLFNVLQIEVEKTLSLTKHLKWRAALYLQQVIGSAPVNVPALYMRNRIGYEGNLGFKNLDLAIGFEVKYRSPYKADNYSPVHGRFFYQDSISISNTLPDISAYVHFRIRPIKFFVRVENLNTARSMGGFGFTNNNLVAPGYAYPGLQFRLGVYWSFVN